MSSDFGHIIKIQFYRFQCNNVRNRISHTLATIFMVQTCLNQCNNDNYWRENIFVKFSSGKGRLFDRQTG